MPSGSRIYLVCRLVMKIGVLNGLNPFASKDEKLEY